MLEIEEIRRRLPLRFPYLMVDRVIEATSEQVVAWKNVTVNEPFFQGHFPEPLAAVMPGTLILESMAQTAAFLLPIERADERRHGYLVGVERARFSRPVVPGDRLELRALLQRRRRMFLQAEVTALVDGKPVASAVLSLMTAGVEGSTKK